MGTKNKKKENADSAKDLNANETAMANIDLILYAFVYPESINSPGSNCPACGFPHTQESTQIRTSDANTGICPECHHKLETLDHGYFVIYQDDKDHLNIAYQWIPEKNNDAIPVKKEQLLEKIMTANTIIKSLYFSANDNKPNTDKKDNDKILVPKALSPRILAFLISMFDNRSITTVLSLTLPPESSK